MATMATCKINGVHEIESIKRLDEGDLAIDIYFLRMGYVFVGVCKHCKGRIMAKDKQEFNFKG